jgi:AcrR family transcriptional regulator
VEEILDAADALIAEVGWDAATTQGIIDRAGASMGSFFHFFPSRNALLEALARRHAARMFEVNEAAMPLDAVGLPPDELFARVVRGQAQYAQAAPALRAIHEAAARTFGAGGPFRELDEAIYDRVRVFVSTRLPRMERAACEACVRLSVSTVHSAVEIAMALPTAQREQVLETARNMLARYVESLDAEYGPPGRKARQR